MQGATGERRVRVVLIGWTGLLGDIIDRAVAAEPQLEVVGDYATSDLDAAASADLVVWNNAQEDDVASWLLSLSRRPRVLATLGDGRDAALWELTPRRTRLGQLSPTALVQAMQAHAWGDPA